MPTLADRKAGGRLELLLYGPPGTGKTVNAHKMPRTRTLDLDDGLSSVVWAVKEGIIDRKLEDIVYETILEDNRKDRGIIRNATVLDRATDAIDKWLEEEEKDESKGWDTLIVDSGSALTDATIYKGLDENARLKLSKTKNDMLRGGLTPMRQQDWGSASSLFKDFIEWVRTLDKNLILICHEYHNTDDTGNVISIDPLLIGQLRQKLPAKFGEVWYATVSGNRRNPIYEFQTSPDSLHRLRSRLGCLDPVEPADLDKIRKKVADFLDTDPSSIWTGGDAESNVGV